MTEAAPTKTSVLLRRMLRSYLRPRLPRLMAAMAWMAVAAAMTGALAKLMEPIIDDVFQEKNPALLVPVALGVMAVFTLRGIAGYAHSVLMNDVGQRIVADVQRDTFGHLMRADLAFFHAHPSGELITRMTADIAVMRMAVAECLTSFGRSTLSLVFLVGVMFYQDWRLAIAAFTVFPLAYFYVARLGKRMRSLGGRSQAELARFASQLGGVFQNARHVKAYGMEGYEAERAAAGIERLYKLAARSFRVSSLSQPVGEGLSGIAMVTLILYGGHQVLTGQNTTGALFSFISAFLFAYEPMKRLGKVNGIMQTGLAAAERVFWVMDQQAAIVERPDALPLAAGAPTVRLEQVRFGYHADGPPALDGVTIEVPAGKTVALVGPSGAGKSTVLNLIPRFYDVDGGAVLVGGQDVRRLTLASLRAGLALVAQETALFDDTVAANIGYGRMGATQAEIEAAARDAAAHDFVTALPQGYQTIVGENGVKLSGGQRQRLAIARAMLRDAPILLLDEATSALDAESERAVQEALKRLRAGRTTLVIAHRLSTIMDADLIYVLDRGRVVESGTHAVLLARGGLYGRLYGLQGAAVLPFTGTGP